MNILIPIVLFLVIFGIFYLYYSTRNRERLALIDKGVDAGIFMRGKTSSGIGKFIILNPTNNPNPAIVKMVAG